MSETATGHRFNDTGTHVATVSPDGVPWWCPQDYLPTALEQGYTLVEDDEVGYAVDRTPAALAAEGAAQDAEKDAAQDAEQPVAPPADEKPARQRSGASTTAPSTTTTAAGSTAGTANPTA